MADNLTKSPSPRLSSQQQQYRHAYNPATPVHSPQHSLHSSTSSRTPLHTLTLHDYRKLQNTPTSQTANRPGKTLRRKPAAAALNELERVPSVSRTPISGSRLASRPLHLSQSAYQLSAHQPLPPSPPEFFEHTELLNQSFRSQSAEPRSSGASGFELSASFEAGKKVSNWKPIKRLPKPRPAWPETHTPLARSPAHTAAVTPLPPLRTKPISLTENAHSSCTQTTPSTFSLSNFPHPPHVIGPSLSPPNDENVPSHLNTSFATTAPVTPPATPAVIHYRGTSFDLVNPHDSLLFHDIVTPSRDLDSSDYLPLRSSEELLLQSEMAQRRPLYGDLSSAYNSIRKRDDSPNTINLDAPLPPPRVALSPESSIYSSPGYTYDSGPAISPLTVKKADTESRFSLKQLKPIKQLTRTFTKKLSKTPAPAETAELQDFSSQPTSPTVGHFDGDYPRTLNESYPNSPVGPTAVRDEALQTERHPFPSYLFAKIRQGETSTQRLSIQRYSSAPLTSMIPDDPSFQVGRGDDYRLSASIGEMTKGYYDEVSSLYPTSSVYTGDGDEGNRGYPDSLYSKRMSNAHAPFEYDDNNNNNFTNPYNRQSTIYSFANTNRTSDRYSQPSTQDFSGHSQLIRDEKTDTISNIIGQYVGGEGGDPAQAVTAEAEKPLKLMRSTSGLSQFDFEIQHGNSNNTSQGSIVSPIKAGRARRPIITQSPGSPPQSFAPLAPAFVYDEIPNIFDQSNSSDLFSGASSYGDTRHLLQVSESAALNVLEKPAASLDVPPNPGHPLKSSSSYSQSDGQNGAETLQDALDHAEQIFEQAENGHQTATIPAMWIRRGSGNLLRRQSTVLEELEDEKGDWETVGGNTSRQGRPSLEDSIADYSSTEGSRASFDEKYQEYSLPTLNASPQGFLPYRHPSPLSTHDHPFSSSPPALSAQASVRTAPVGSVCTLTSADPSYSSTVPHFQSRTKGYDDEPYMPLADPGLWNRPSPSPYTLSDKETQELLNSGPNDEILYEGTQGFSSSANASPPCSSPFHVGYENGSLERDNTFAKLSMLGPKGNLTGTPQGTGMHEVGSSVADNSSPGAEWSSSPLAQQRPTGFPWYNEPEKGSSRQLYDMERHGRVIEPNHQRTTSQDTFFPNHFRLKAFGDDLSPSPNSSPVSSRPRSMWSSRSGRSTSRSQGYGRPAVAGQTKLREMILASDTQTVSSGHSTHMSQFIRSGHSERPCSNNTISPLRPQPAQASQTTLKQVMASVRSPRLHCVEKQLSEEEEAEREKLSWYIFFAFCTLPPLVCLYRWFGDSLVVWISKGRFGHAHPVPKRIAVLTGVSLTFFLVVAIAVPILVLWSNGKILH